MPVPAGVARVNVTATLAEGEQMVHAMHFRIAPNFQPPVGAAALMETLADRVAEVWSQMIAGFTGATFSSLGSMLANTTVYNTVDAYELDAQGRALSQGQAAIVNGAGISSNTPLPSEVALVGTLLSGFPGRTARGRIYLGGFTTSTVAATGRATPATTERVARNLAQFLASMTAGDQGFDAIVLSKTTTSVREIIRVTCGDVFDVQRRRRNKLREVRFSAEK